MGMKKTSVRRLKTLEDARRFLADVTNKLNRDQIDANKASKLGYLIQILARIIEGNDLEKRLAVLEQAVKETR